MPVRNFRVALVATASVMSVLSVDPAAAQVKPEGVPPPGEATVADQPTTQDAGPDEIVVVGYRASQQSSIASKRRADQVVDAINAEEFGQFPDQNVAEAIQRVTGVSLARNNGEGDTVTIRGLDPSLTRVEVNGRSTFLNIDSDQPSRATSLSIFGPDQFSSIEVIKSPTAKDDEGGVGGIVRLKTPKPLDIGRRVVRASAQARRNSVAGNTDPGFSAAASDTFLDKRLGIYLSGSFDDRTRRVDQIQALDGWTAVTAVNAPKPAVANLIGGIFPISLGQQIRTGEQPRTNFDGTIQFKPTDTLELYANGTFAREDRTEDITRLAVNFARARPFVAGVRDAETDTISFGQVTNSQLTLNNRGLHRDIKAYGYTGGFAFDNETWDLSGRYDKSVGQEIGNDRRVRHRGQYLAAYDLRDDPRAPTLQISGIDLTNPSLFKIDANWMEYRLIRTDEQSGQLDGARELSWGPLTRLSFGAKLRETKIRRTEGVARGPINFTFANGDNTFPVDDAFDGVGGPGFIRTFATVDATDFVDRLGPSVADAKAAIDPSLGYTLDEKGTAGYAMLNFANDEDVFVRGNAGVRVVRTRLTANGNSRRIVTTTGSTADTPLTARNAYTEVLPSLNAVISRSEDAPLLLRVAVGRVMTRPTPENLAPSTQIDFDTLQVTRGNPLLDPFVANQADLGVEYYFGSSRGGLVSLAGFYKDVSNFIEPFSFTEELVLVPGQSAETVSVSSFRNGGNGKIKGFEFSLQTPLTLLGGWSRGLGGAVNYTFLDSSRKLVNGTSAEILGNSKHTLNAILFYERSGFSTRFAYNYRSGYLENQSGPAGNRISVESNGRLDFSMRYRLKNGLRLSFDVANVFQEGRYSYTDTKDRLIQKQLEGRIWTVGAGYTF